MNTFQDKDKRKALVISIIIYAGLALLFLYFGLKYPDPPLEESGIEISMADYGYDDVGSGDLEPSMSASTPQEEVSANESSEDQNDSPELEDVVTQEESEVSLPKTTPEVKKVESEKVTPVKENTETQSEKVQEIDDKLKNVLGAWEESENTDNEGSQPGTFGNEGVESGNLEGRGTFGGNGSSFELGGRSMIAGPSIGEKPTEEGKVVLNIWVDRQGNILRISHNLQESTTTSQYLFNLAKKAAQKAKFNPSPSAAPEQKGKMTFIFILR